jgi:hypothetical protein
LIKFIQKGTFLLILSQNCNLKIDKFRLKFTDSMKNYNFHKICKCHKICKIYRKIAFFYQTNILKTKSKPKI